MITDFWNQPTSETKSPSKYVYARQAAYYERNREKIIERVKAYNAQNKEKIKARKIIYRNKNRKRLGAEQRTFILKHNYGLSPTEWAKLFDENGRKCAICGTSDFGKQGPATDHCHRTKRVRGILCHRHNMALGLFNDDPTLLESAIKYLKADKT